MTLLATPGVVFASRSDCLAGTGTTAIAACETQIASTGPATDLSLALAQHLQKANRRSEARRVLQTAAQRTPGNEEVEKLLRVISSEIEEEEFMAKRRAQQEKRRSPAEIRRNQIRCSRQRGQAALDACNALAGSFPKDAQLAARRGLLMAGLGQDADALEALTLAKRLGSKDPKAEQTLKALEAARGKPAPAPSPAAVATITRRLKFDPVNGVFSER